jgi:FixJ family two-component response regulator
MEAAPRVFVVDDDPSVVRAIERLLRSSGFVVETFTSPASFLERLPYDGVACVVLDMRMPNLSGLDVQGAIASKAPTMPAVFLSGASDVPTAATAMRKGALDFLVKPIDETELIDAVSRALAAAAESVTRRQEETEVSQRLARLTKRERQVCELVAQGLLNKQIAYELGVSEATIKAHVSAILLKLNVDSRTQAVIQLGKINMAMVA